MKLTSRILIVILVALVTGIAPTTEAQVARAKASVANAPAKSHPGAKPRGGPQEGIKVHGHWVIEVRNPDGTLATRREFENSLDPQGAQNLAALLARAASGGHWLITFDGAASGPCPGAKGASGGKACYIAESGPSFPYDAPGPGLSTDLVVTLAGPSQNQVVLSGSVKALAVGDVYVVGTQQGVCAGNMAPQNCTNTSSPGSFSRAFLNAPIQVQQGQIVQVTVTFSFS